MPLKVYTFGEGAFGKLGHNCSHDDVTIPTQVMELNDMHIQQVRETTDAHKSIKNKVVQNIKAVILDVEIVLTF